MDIETVEQGRNNRHDASLSEGRRLQRKSSEPKLGTAKSVEGDVLKRPMDVEPDIPWERIAGFMRQLTHEVRNGLNSLDLEAALMQELATDDEAHACAARARQQVRRLADQLRSLSALFQKPQPATACMSARELFLNSKEQHAGISCASEVRWVEELGSEEIDVDESMMATVFRELLTNASAFTAGSKPVTLTARGGNGAVMFELREPKPDQLDPADWDRAFFTGRRGHFGLGLWNVRRLVEANSGTITRRFLEKESALVTTLRLPVVPKGNPNAR
jgi:signal transduction histidine kinase